MQMPESSKRIYVAVRQPDERRGEKSILRA